MPSCLSKQACSQQLCQDAVLDAEHAQVCSCWEMLIGCKPLSAGSETDDLLPHTWPLCPHLQAAELPCRQDEMLGELLALAKESWHAWRIEGGVLSSPNTGGFQRAAEAARYVQASAVRTSEITDEMLGLVFHSH